MKNRLYLTIIFLSQVVSLITFVIFGLNGWILYSTTIACIGILLPIFAIHFGEMLKALHEKRTKTTRSWLVASILLLIGISTPLATFLNGNHFIGENTLYVVCTIVQTIYGSLLGSLDT